MQISEDGTFRCEQQTINDLRKTLTIVKDSTFSIALIETKY